MQCMCYCIFLTFKHRPILGLSRSNLLTNYRKLPASNRPILENFRKEIQEFKSDIADSDKDLIIKNKRVSYSLKHYEAISQYLDSIKGLSQIKPKIPGHYLLRKYSNPNTLHIVDPDVARQIFDAIKPHLKSRSKGYIYEVNAGYGLLTAELVKAKFPRLHIYEADSTLHKDLHIFLLRHKSDAKLFKSNLLMYWPIIAKKDVNIEGHVADDIYEGLPTFEWEDDPVLKIIVTIPSVRFLDHMMWCITHQTDLFNYGRYELFVIMPPLIYLKCTSTPKDGYALYRFKSVLFQILFEHTLLAKLPEKAFLPWVRKAKGKFTPPEEDVMYLVKVTPRQDLLQKVPLRLLLPLRFFIRTIMYKRKSPVIPTFEKWMPGSGVRLISQGMTIFTKCGTLTPDQVFKLFLQFTSWPEFESSAFLSSMDSINEKMRIQMKGIWFNLLKKENSEESMYDSDDEDVSDKNSKQVKGEESMYDSDDEDVSDKNS